MAYLTNTQPYQRLRRLAYANDIEAAVELAREALRRQDWDVLLDAAQVLSPRAKSNFYMDPRRLAFMKLLERANRSWFSNLFLKAVRSGQCVSPRDVCRHVWRELERRLVKNSNLDRARYAKMENIMRHSVDAVLAYAAWCIEWETLSKEEKTKVKNSASSGPSNKQLEYLAALGYEGDQPDTKAQASELIGMLKGGS